MSAKVVIMDGQRGKGQCAGVTPIGELILAGFGALINKTSFQTLGAAVVNFFGPITGQQFVITSITMDGNNSDVVIYEASNPSTATVEKALFSLHLGSNANLFVPFQFGGFLAVSEGAYINATNSAGTTNITIVGYYSPVMH